MLYNMFRSSDILNVRHLMRSIAQLAVGGNFPMGVFSRGNVRTECQENFREEMFADVLVDFWFSFSWEKCSWKRPGDC